jgi:hypothetical protein
MSKYRERMIKAIFFGALVAIIIGYLFPEYEYYIKGHEISFQRYKETSSNFIIKKEYFNFKLGMISGAVFTFLMYFLLKELENKSINELIGSGKKYLQKFYTNLLTHKTKILLLLFVIITLIAVKLFNNSYSKDLNQKPKIVKKEIVIPVIDTSTAGTNEFDILEYETPINPEKSKEDRIRREALQKRLDKAAKRITTYGPTPTISGPNVIAGSKGVTDGHAKEDSTKGN